ncbi:MAG: hypothetical protein ACI4HL_00195 [Ruminococcus sp.]
MRIERVAERFSLLSGIEGEELSKWTPLIKDSVAYVSALIKPGVKESEHLERLESASATYAYYKWILCSEEKDSSSFKAGDLSVSQSHSGATSQLAYQLWKQSLNEIADITVTNNFFFKGVGV